MNNSDQKADAARVNRPGAEFEARIERAFPIERWEGIKVVVAVSGGADSVALLRGLCGLADRLGSFDGRKNLWVAHVDHGVRGEQSNEDAKFVERLANELDLEFLVARAENGEADSGQTRPLNDSEESLRNFRYDHLLELAHQVGARYIATGHNYDDQVETILFRIFRGTGVAGLSGIPMKRLASESVTLVRPLLETKRFEIEAYLKDLGQGFRNDESNSNSRYKRNYLRNELIPELENQFGSNLAESISRLGVQAKETHQFLVEQSKSLFESVVACSDASVELDCHRLQHESKVLVRQFLVELWIKQGWPRQAMGYQWWSELTRVIYEASDRQVVLNLPGGIRLEKRGKRAKFSDRI